MTRTEFYCPQIEKPRLAFNSREQAVSYLGESILLLSITTFSWNCCTKHSSCWGGWDGFYIYADGSKNKGERVTAFRVETETHFIFWFDSFLLD